MKRRDDSPGPERTTPRRLAARLEEYAQALARLSLELRTFDPYLGDQGLGREYDSLRNLSERLMDRAVMIRTGVTPLAFGVDAAAGRGDRPLLDAIEDAAPPLVPTGDGETAPKKRGRPASTPAAEEPTQ